jgi:hypothetical protein
MINNPTQQILENLAAMLNKMVPLGPLDKSDPLVGDVLDLIALAQDQWSAKQYQAAADLVDQIHAIIHK